MKATMIAADLTAGMIVAIELSGFSYWIQTGDSVTALWSILLGLYITLNHLPKRPRRRRKQVESP